MNSFIYHRFLFFLSFFLSFSFSCGESYSVLIEERILATHLLPNKKSENPELQIKISIKTRLKLRLKMSFFSFFRIIVRFFEVTFLPFFLFSSRRKAATSLQQTPARNVLFLIKLLCASERLDLLSLSRARFTFLIDIILF